MSEYKAMWESLKIRLESRTSRMFGDSPRKAAYEDVILLMEDMEES